MDPFNGGFFFDTDDPTWVDRFREVLPPDRAEAVIRLIRHLPEPLSEEEHRELWVTLRPVLHDLTAKYGRWPTIIEESWQPADLGFVTASLEGDGGSRTGISVSTSASAGQRLVDLADQVQDFIVEELPRTNRPAVWPECPLHPDTHPLRPELDEPDVAVWRCPRTRQTISRIGELDSPHP